MTILVDLKVKAVVSIYIYINYIIDVLMLANISEDVIFSYIAILL